MLRNSYGKDTGGPDKGRYPQTYSDGKNEE